MKLDLDKLLSEKKDTKIDSKGHFLMLVYNLRATFQQPWVMKE